MIAEELDRKRFTDTDPIEPRKALPMRTIATLLLALFFLLPPFLVDAGTPRPKVLCYGDSLMAGLLSDGLCGALGRARPDLQVVNAGLGGDVSTNTARLDAYLALDSYAVVVILIGTNDWASGQTPKQVYQNVWTLGQHAKADGAEVLLLTLLPVVACGPPCNPAATAAHQQFTADVSDWLRWRDLDNTHAHVTVGDLREALSVPGFDGFDGDGIHPTPAGNTFLAGVVAGWIP